MGQDQGRASAMQPGSPAHRMLCLVMLQVHPCSSASFCCLRQEGVVLQVGQQGDQPVAGLGAHL